MVYRPNDAVIVFNDNQLECVRDGTNYRLPTSLATLQSKHLEVTVAEAKATKLVNERKKAILLAHQKDGHNPRAPKGECTACDYGAVTAGDGKKLQTNFQLAEGEWSLSIDFAEVDVRSVSGNSCALNMCNQFNMGAVVATPNHSATETLKVFQEGLRIMRLAANIPPDQPLKIKRIHSDKAKSFGADLEKYIREKGWLQTTTEGYDSNAAARIERRNRSILDVARVCLLDATGGRHTY